MSLHWPLFPHDDAAVEIAQGREKAGKVASWLIEKGRPDEAVGLLVAWAAHGPNDPAGQDLMAQALRVDPSSHLAQQAFERMEGIAGDHRELEGAFLSFGPDFLSGVEKEMRKPSFRRAQMGFNNNIKFKNTVFHVQTEDSCLDSPHIITHLFADGGRVIKSHKRSYEKEVARDDITEYVRGLMKSQHLEVVMKLRDGSFDRIISGEEIGGMQVLSEPPNVDILKLKKKSKEKAAQQATGGSQGAGASRGAGAAAAAVASPPAGANPAPGLEQGASLPQGAARAQDKSHAASGTSAANQVLFQLHVLRSLSGGPESYSPPGTSATIGAKGAIALEGERFSAPEEALLSLREDKLYLEDLDAGNGVFLRVNGSVELEMGDEFIVGDQLLKVQKNPVPDDGPAPDPTYFYSSPKWPSSFRVVQAFEGGVSGASAVARGNALQVGAAVGDLLFPDDPLVSEQHCLIEEQAGTVVLTDIGSRTGVFVRVRGEQVIHNGDELLVGRTRLVVDTSSASGA
ncbi:MAG: FHA domain-containing protein [Polyangiaceae bacterium]|nr:FHA domain-containing protein [Polyangiaceae bacterium]